MHSDHLALGSAVAGAIVEIPRNQVVALTERTCTVGSPGNYAVAIIRRCRGRRQIRATLGGQFLQTGGIRRRRNRVMDADNLVLGTAVSVHIGECPRNRVVALAERTCAGGLSANVSATTILPLRGHRPKRATLD